MKVDNKELIEIKDAGCFIGCWDEDKKTGDGTGGNICQAHT